MEPTKQIRLKKCNFSKEEIEELKSYCVSMGYILDQDAEEFNGKYLILRSKNQKHKGFLQKEKGIIYWIYNNKKENLSSMLLLFNKFIDRTKKKKGSTLLKFLCGITDFEYKSQYK